MAEDPEIFEHWFKFYLNTKTLYEVKDEDTYNMDEKGFLQGVIAKFKVMISKYEVKTPKEQVTARVKEVNEAKEAEAKKVKEAKEQATARPSA